MTNRIATYYRHLWQPPQTDCRLLAIIKRHPAEVYVFLYPDTRDGQVAAMRAFGRYASDPELSFTWYDAAKASQKVREAAR